MVGGQDTAAESSPIILERLIGIDDSGTEGPEGASGPVTLAVHSMADMTEVSVQPETEIEDLKKRAAQHLVLLPQHGTGSVLLDMATGKALPGNSTVSACRLTASSRLLLLGKSRLYAPKDVQVSGILVYTRLKKKKFNLAKPPTLQENEDLLLRLDTIEYDGEVNGVSLETTLGHFKTLPMGPREHLSKEEVREIFIPLNKLRRYLTG
ncbi:unnamed protein product [Durusdinium trenchii]|uniref:Cleavage and polyadenylation specificity factor subunit 2 n=2 Tax=Durusdinium trenchii TaxID=1381693 RepID=A0ABP0KNW2_9DINO